MQVLGYDALHIRRLNFFDPGSKTLEKVGGIPVKLVRHPFAQDLFWGVEVEDEGIENRIFGPLDLVFGDGVGLQIINLLVQRLHRLDRALALGSHRNSLDAWVIESASNAPANGIRESQS